MSDPAVTLRWYVRRGSQILGPYGVEDLERYILLGRVRLSDQLSPDGYTWVRLSDRPDWLPAAMRDMDTPEGRERFEAARRDVDERAVDEHGPEAVDSVAGRRQDDPSGPLVGARGRAVMWIAGASVALVAAVLLILGWWLDLGA